MQFLRARARAAAHAGTSACRSRLGLVSLPRFAHIALRVEKSSRDWGPLGHPEWRLIFKRLRGLDVAKIVGDDPFERDDIEDVLMSLFEEIRPALFQVGTPGGRPMRVESFARRLQWPGLHMRVRMEGWPSEESVGRETLDRLIALKRGGARFSLGLNYHLTPETLEEMTEAEAYCTQHGVGFFPGIPVHSVVFQTDPAGLKDDTVNPDCAAALFASLRALDSERYGRIAGRIWGSANQRQLRGLLSQGPNQRFRCQELGALIYVMPDGSVVACGHRFDPLGSLLESTPEVLWQSAEIRNARDQIQDCMGCYQMSVQLASALYGGDWW